MLLLMMRSLMCKYRQEGESEMTQIPYIKSAEAEDIITVPEEYLNIKLYKQDKDVLCNYLNIKEDGKLRKWTTIKRMFGKSGYSIIDGVDSGGKARYSIIKRK